MLQNKNSLVRRLPYLPTASNNPWLLITHHHHHHYYGFGKLKLENLSLTNDNDMPYLL